LKTLIAALAVANALSAQGVQTLRGGGLEVTVDLTGWKQTLPASILHDNYIRLGTYDFSPQGHLAILVDQLPEGIADAAGLCERSIVHHRGATILEPSTFAGKPGCLLVVPADEGFASLYLEIAIANRWLEWHYSAPTGPTFSEDGKRALEPIIASFSANADPSGLKLPQVELTDQEVSFVERLQKCVADSTGFVCGALAAFKKGKRPQGRPKPSGVAGASFPLVFDAKIAASEDLQPMAGYVVVSDTQIHQEFLDGKLNKKFEAAAKEVIASAKLLKKPPEKNAIVIMARSDDDAEEALQSERSLLIPTRGPGKIYLRDTAIGLVSVAIVPGAQGSPLGFVLGIYPK
jgi:hypothetical protein